MSGDPCICGDTKTWHQECYRRALAAQAPQAAEPVARVGKGRGTFFMKWTDHGKTLPPGTYELYLAPQAPAAQPLTDAGIHAAPDGVRSALVELLRLKSMMLEPLRPDDYPQQVHAAWEAARRALSVSGSEK